MANTLNYDAWHIREALNRWGNIDCIITPLALFSINEENVNWLPNLLSEVKFHILAVL